MDTPSPTPDREQIRPNYYATPDPEWPGNARISARVLLYDQATEEEIGYAWHTTAGYLEWMPTQPTDGLNIGAMITAQGALAEYCPCDACTARHGHHCAGCDAPVGRVETLCEPCQHRERMMAELLKQGLPLMAGGSDEDEPRCVTCGCRERHHTPIGKYDWLSCEGKGHKPHGGFWINACNCRQFMPLTDGGSGE